MKIAEDAVNERTLQETCGLAITHGVITKLAPEARG
jgi:hypothetical protein